MRPQKQPGFAIVTATVPLGDFTGEQMRVLADLSLAFSDGSVRITPDQDLVFRWVPLADVETLYEHLAAAGLSLPDAGTIADVTSCPGAESCRLAVTQSRGLGKLLGDHLRERPHLVDAAPDVHIKISGCPNGCGQHHVAGIGFQGSIRKIAGRPVPAVLRDGRRRRGPRWRTVRPAGGEDPGPAWARGAGAVAGSSTPQERTDGETATAFFGRVDLPRLKQVARRSRTAGA